MNWGEIAVTAVLGIIVTGVYFWISERRARGAARERARNAEASIARALLRRLVLEGYEPSRQDIGRLLEAKARECDLGMQDLPTVDEILRELYSRVVDSDFVSRSKRAELEGRIAAAMAGGRRPLEVEVPVNDAATAQPRPRTAYLVTPTRERDRPQVLDRLILSSLAAVVTLTLFWVTTTMLSANGKAGLTLSEEVFSDFAWVGVVSLATVMTATVLVIYVRRKLSRSKKQ